MSNATGSGTDGSGAATAGGAESAPIVTAGDQPASARAPASSIALDATSRRTYGQSAAIVPASAAHSTSSTFVTTSINLRSVMTSPVATPAAVAKARMIA